MSTCALRPAALSALLLLVCASGQAQPGAAPPTGPAEIIKRAGQARDRADIERSARAGEAAAQQADGADDDAQGEPEAAEQDAEPAAHAADSGVADGGAADGGVADGDAAAGAAAAPAGRLGNRPPPTEYEDQSLPRGTIEVHLADPQGRAQPNNELVLGMMGNQGEREELKGTTNGSGVYRFSGLAVGLQKAYRVNATYGGAKFSSAPFRLGERFGHRVDLTLRPTTADDDLILQVVGQTGVELRDDRIHVTHQARLANAGTDTFVFPEDGLLIRLPKGFTAFQWQQQMTDQRGTEVPGEGFRLAGSLPPGTVTLAWGYDVERDGSTAQLDVHVPFRTYTYRIIAEAPDGLDMRVDGFPEPERAKDNGRQLLFTQVQSMPGDAPLASFKLELTGIPGPGPGRWVALVLAALLAAIGLARALKPADAVRERKDIITSRKQYLLSTAKQVQAELARGEIGPEYHARRMDELTTELALVLRDEETLGIPA